MKVDAIMENKGNKEEEDGEESATNEPESVSFREPDNEAVRMKEDLDM